MDIEQLCMQKQYIFDHIFYEFWMYKETYIKLRRILRLPSDICKDKQFWINVFLESHATHLRNLLHFFSGKDSINADTVFKDKIKLGIAGVEDKIKVINLSISHITIERVERANGEGNLTTEMGIMIDEMFPEISDRIRKYLDSLSREDRIKEEFFLNCRWRELETSTNRCYVCTTTVSLKRTRYKSNCV